MIFLDTFNESVSTIIERKVRGWLSGVIDDMRRSSPVQQWLDSLPTEPAPDSDHSNEETLVKTEEAKSDDSKAEETVTENTVIEPIKEKIPDDHNLDVPNVTNDAWKRKSLDSGLLTSTPQRGNVKRLQRDHSIQSEGYSPKFKNPLFRDHSLQVNCILFDLMKHNKIKLCDLCLSYDTCV